MNIEEFNFKDRLIKGITTDGHFKISVVKTTEVVKTARDNHQLSLLNTVILGRALTATMLLASELKGEERIRMRMDGDGPIGFIVAEANSVGEIRGYVKNPVAELDYSNPETELGDGIGLGIMTFSKVLYNEAEPKTSTIELIKGDVNSDVAHYLAQSEQIPSALLTDVGIDEDGNVTEAGGLMIQRLPGAPDGQIDMLQERLGSFPPIDELLADDQYIDEIMNKAVSPLKAKELNRQPVDFFCRCSRKRFLNALAMLNYEDLKEMDGEGQEMVCQYCNNREFISKEEIEKIVMDAQAKMN
ncbi:MAG: Hsp33 family molecular chaperone HslO [Gracilimonas sp.]|uniref:Hsp33 family molecular chaperone HslO n=1 Tax=Gracilimonas TaxID=649462 RepID=UPI001B13556D|nr:Hsp33 family molecular chaperone HslO [Gracilimonas sp.]MBO6585091.1 Hsp33 family molecular chaperone HslO [Gracilimonas sp.]MBO6615638.1 Hsp33 family molecular chaperone HslO [Gracilimonas sp.]